MCGWAGSCTPCWGGSPAVRADATRRAPRGTAPKRDAWRSCWSRCWDGEWYRRGYYDDGTPLGSAQNDECKIDSIAQSWAVLSGAAPLRAERAIDAVRTHLVGRGSGVMLVLTPPFDQSAQDPGYVKGYPPGVRENGGQYTHAAVWTVMAVAQLGNGDEAVELFHLLNPINHTRTRRASSATRPSPTSWRRTCTPTRRTPGAEAGPGTRARPGGCTAPDSRASWA